MAPTASSIENVNYVASQALVSTVSAVASATLPFTDGTQLIDFDLLPPFVAFLVYKAAAIVTERLLMGSDSTEDEITRLRTLRKFLWVVGERWQGCSKSRTPPRQSSPEWQHRAIPRSFERGYNATYSKSHRTDIGTYLGHKWHT